MASSLSIRLRGGFLRWCLAALVALSLVSSGCASSRDRTMARIFEAPNVIRVCVRPPNVPKDKRTWAIDASGSPVFGVREVDHARRAGLGVYIFDPESPPESARLLPIPHHRLECPAPPKPRVAAAKVDDAEGKKKEEEKPKAERPAKKVAWQRCPEPGQTRRRSGTGGRTCTRTLVYTSEQSRQPSFRRAEEPPAAEPSPVEVPVPKDPSELQPGEVIRYEEWRQTPEETARLERAYECLTGACHARHKNFQPKDQKTPAGKHNGQSLSTGSGSAGGAGSPQPAAKTTVKTRTKSVAKPNGAKPNGAAAGQGGQTGQAGSGSAADPPPQAKPKRGGENPAAARGRQEHEEFKKKVKEKEGEGWRANPSIKKDGKELRPDALTPKGNPIELKPNTPTGKAAGKRQMKKYEDAYQKKGRVIYYEP